MEALLLPILLIAVFYFLLIRPQQRQRRQMQHMQQTLSVGSEVMTGAGLLGTVVEIDEDKDQVVLEVAPGVTNRYVRRAIVNILDSPESEIADTPEELMDASGELRDVGESANTDKPAEDTEVSSDTDSRNRANDGESR
ncbi:preprotein translocase subunit YajC [Phytoactinopolyspora mesophila]|uniref:Preprotein translocase subunit YajC n=1 Tax=Phytoactinopolyspora mesophila TaxID=2650750 RepID=A0A7K3LYA3_9ACTN|nr:preprotein translocase subunit YajC [Phytoactinopolyspora mesophila]NDL56005.1 preprotein translocase subunit YajC [Phytoactinopolyspora mesophila]